MLTDAAAIVEGGLRSTLIKANARLFSQAYEHAHIAAASQLIAVSTNVKDELEGRYRLGGLEPLVVENGVDSDRLICRTTPVAAPRALYVGRLGYRKGLGRLLEAIAASRRPDLQLELAGEGPLRGMLYRRAVALGIADRVHFLGFLDQEQLCAAHRRAGVYVHVADYEACALALLEAMALGTPVVTTPAGFVAELAAPRPLSLVPPDADAIARGIEEVLAAPAAMHERALEARRLVERQYSWDSVAGRTAALYWRQGRCAA